ncbi:phosphate metabolism protein 7 [Coemansia sp. RSA 1821]|nr:phosphate metabolism protein 7 [Coemansia sp. RSA 1086]KAJ1751706.1 phosphate metabolism protein 7 [Coemansia sp. RSA 1821]
MSSSSAESDNTSDNSVPTFTSSLIFNVVVGAAIFVAFCILRPRFKRVYAPRTYAVGKEKRSPPISNWPLAWIPAVLKVDDDAIVQRVGLDTYMFLRYMRSIFVIFVVLSFLSLVTILPVNITGDGGATGLDVLTIANVPSESAKLWVHIVFFMVFVAWVLRNIFVELQVYTRLRIWWLTNPSHTSKVGASTIMVSSLPEALTDSDDKIQKTFNMFPGGVRQVIVNRNCSDLEELVEDRDSYVATLEKLLTSYAAKSEKLYKKSTKKGTEYKAPKRPTMRESKIPFKGPKLDSFEFLATKIGELNRKIAEMGADPEQFKRQSSAFVFFNKQIAAHMAAQTVLDYKPFSMNMVSLEISPDDIIWSNLNLNPYDRRIRSYISLAATVGIVIVWTLMTSALTALVSVKNLRKIPGLENMSDSKFFGIFTGVVPAGVLAIVMALLPIILRLLLRLEGTTRVSEVNLRLLNRYFFFQVWNVYLVSIFTSSILTIATDGLKDPGSIIDLIPSKVPGSSTTILTYILLLAFAGAAKEILQIVRLALRYILPLLFAKTPRKICNAETPAEFDWATSIPTHSLIFLMGFSYSFIAPIVNCFAAVYFGLFYLVYRYQFLYVYNDSNWVTGGLSFPKSIKQTMVGVYISEIYMLLMMVAKLANNDNINANAILRIIFPALILLLTIFAHVYINDAYMPIINYLPIRGAVEIEENPRIASKFPDVTASGDITNDDLETDSVKIAEDRVRRMIYATYGSLVPRKLIDYVLNKVPRLLNPKKRDDPIASSSSSAPQILPEITETSASSPDLEEKMPVPHHYSTHTGVVRPISDNSNILSVDSQNVRNAAYSVPMIDEPLDQTDAPSIHSVTSATELRQRRRQALASCTSVNTMEQRKSRYSMVDTGPLVSAGANALAEAFSNPALRANAATCLWVPLDNFGLCNELYANVESWGEGTIKVVSEGTHIDEKGHVRADVEFDPDDTDFIKRALNSHSKDSAN